MTIFYLSDSEAEYLEFILAEDLELGSAKTDFITELLTAVRHRDTLKFNQPPQPPQVGNVVHVNFN
jgi:hypothetical protein